MSPPRWSHYVPQFKTSVAHLKTGGVWKSLRKLFASCTCPWKQGEREKKHHPGADSLLRESPMQILQFSSYLWPLESTKTTLRAAVSWRNTWAELFGRQPAQKWGLNHLKTELDDPGKYEWFCYYLNHKKKQIPESSIAKAGKLKNIQDELRITQLTTLRCFLQDQDKGRFLYFLKTCGTITKPVLCSTFRSRKMVKYWGFQQVSS